MHSCISALKRPKVTKIVRHCFFCIGLHQPVLFNSVSLRAIRNILKNSHFLEEVCSLQITVFLRTQKCLIVKVCFYMLFVEHYLALNDHETILSTQTSFNLSLCCLQLLCKLIFFFNTKFLLCIFTLCSLPLPLSLKVSDPFNGVIVVSVG